ELARSWSISAKRLLLFYPERRRGPTTRPRRQRGAVAMGSGSNGVGWGWTSHCQFTPDPSRSLSSVPSAGGALGVRTASKQAASRGDDGPNQTRIDGLRHQTMHDLCPDAEALLQQIEVFPR